LIDISYSLDISILAKYWYEAVYLEVNQRVQLYVSFIKGDATNKNDLDRANFKDAKTAIILSNKEDKNDA